jgi:hypothetical protein
VALIVAAAVLLLGAVVALVFVRRTDAEIDAEIHGSPLPEGAAPGLVTEIVAGLPVKP